MKKNKSKEVLIKYIYAIKIITSKIKVPQVILNLVRKTKLRLRLMVSFLVLSSVPLMIVGFISYTKSSTAISDKTKIYTKQILNQVSNNYEMELKKHINIVKQTIINKDIQNNLNYFENKSVLEKNKINDIFKSIITKYKASEDAIYGQVVYINKKEPLLGTSTFTRERNNSGVEKFEIAKKSLNNNNKDLFFLTLKSYDNYDLLWICKNIKNPNNLKHLGIFISAIKIDYLANIYRDVDLGDGAKIFIIDKEGTVISSIDKKLKLYKKYPDKNLINSIIKNENEEKESKNKNFDTSLSMNVSNVNSLVNYSKLMKLIGILFVQFHIHI